MRTLKFNVDGLSITPNPDCDFSGLVPGSEGYLKAEFIFSQEWTDLTKAAAFFSVLGKEYTPKLLEDGKSCIIPAEALAKRKFKIRVIGQGKDGNKLITNKVTVSQNGGN